MPSDAHSIDNAQRHLEETIWEQQAIHSRVFGELYKRTFLVLDNLTMHLHPVMGKKWPFVQARLSFDWHVRKTDDAILRLVPLVEMEIITKKELRHLIRQSYGLERLEEEPPKKTTDPTHHIALEEAAGKEIEDGALAQILQENENESIF